MPARSTKTQKMYEATDSFTYGDGYHVVHKGELVAEGSDAYKANPDAFKETDYHRPDVEQSTAAPGEKR